MNEPMKAMWDGQNHAVAVVRAALKGGAWDGDGCTPELRALAVELSEAQTTIKKTMWIVGILCGLDHTKPWTAQEYTAALDAWLARAKSGAVAP